MRRYLQISSWLTNAEFILAYRKTHFILFSFSFPKNVFRKVYPNIMTDYGKEL